MPKLIVTCAVGSLLLAGCVRTHDIAPGMVAPMPTVDPGVQAVVEQADAPPPEANLGARRSRQDQEMGLDSARGTGSTDARQEVVTRNGEPASPAAFLVAREIGHHVKNVLGATRDSTPRCRRWTSSDAASCEGQSSCRRTVLRVSGFIRS